MSKTGNAPLIPGQFGLSPDQVRAMTASPLAEIAAHHEAMASTLGEAGIRAGMAKACGLHKQADDHARWAKVLRGVIAAQQQGAWVPRLRVVKGGRG